MNEEPRQLLFTEFFNQKLKEHGLTLEELSAMSGISLKHLEHFSHGRFELLPPTPYLHGYFERLAPILEFDPEAWWEKIKVEGMIKTSGREDRMAENRFARNGRGFWVLAGVILIVAAFFALRYSAIFGEPRINLTNPPSGLARTSEDHVVVEGYVTNADELTVNGIEMQREKDGYFRTEVPLQPNTENSIEVRARKILGRTTSITREIYYDSNESPVILPINPSSSSAESSSSATSGLR